jgi:hypothetical protein
MIRMIRVIAGPQRILLSALATIAVTLFAGPAMAGSSGCKAPQYRQFDFWLGSWKAYDNDGMGPYVARDYITAMLGGCVVLERYRQNDGHGGNGFTLYDASRDLWHQTWVTNSGQLLILEGKFKDGVLAMSGDNLGTDGKRIWYRVVWKRQTTGKAGVRETAITSKDGGKSWQPAFDILFVKEQTG